MNTIVEVLKSTLSLKSLKYNKYFFLNCKYHQVNRAKLVIQHLKTKYKINHPNKNNTVVS